MNHIERFRAVCRGDAVDYVPVLGLPGASGVAFGGAWGDVYRRLIETGMPNSVEGWTETNAFLPEASLPWSEYWGTLSPISASFWACDQPGRVRHVKKVRNGYELIEYETGAVTRQVLNNDDAYSMPSFESHHVRDRQSWDHYKRCMSPSPPWSADKVVEACRPFQTRDRPLCMNLGSTWGGLRDLMGPERACTVMYDEPELAREIVEWQRDMRRAYQFPLVECLRPEIVLLHEDCCYNHGMMINPRHFTELCGESYREVAQLKSDMGIEMFAVDSDGDVARLIPVIEELGADAVYPMEAKANRDLAALARANPKFILLGGLEKEVVNEGNERLIESEIRGKAPALLERGRYFPNIDHTLQPMCTFDNLRRFMTVLHEVLGNPEGSFPRL
ncbi:MAG TPA: hypothetical protein DD670_07730 [Planctomycetaceae bacterium]|nr:hypothetical protein [Planctomycetaceae bacterium]